MFSTDEDYENIMELFIDPLRDKVYEKYYQKQLVQQVLEDVLKKDDEIFKVYCENKPLIENEDISVSYIDEKDETLLKHLMRERLDDNVFMAFEKLLDKAGEKVLKTELEFLAEEFCMAEHFWVEYNSENKK